MKRTMPRQKTPSNTVRLYVNGKREAKNYYASEPISRMKQISEHIRKM